MKSRMIVAGSLMILILVAAAQPNRAQASTRVHVGFDLGEVYLPVEHYPRYGHYRPPPRYYGADRWHRMPPPPPPRGWYRHHPPPPVYYNDYRHPRHHQQYWGRNRW